MFITGIIEPKRHPHRRQIHLDGVLAFTCNVNVVARFRLRAGMTLSDEQVREIQRGEIRQQCFDRAMKYLKVRLHSRAELFRKLAGRGCDEAVIVDVLDQLVQTGYVNDEEFARARARSAAEHKQHGKERARMELLKAGIGEDVIDRALDDVYNPADSLAAARLLIEKQAVRLRKLDPLVARRRLAGMLERRGFEYEAVKPIVDELLGDENEIHLATDEDG